MFLVDLFNQRLIAPRANNNSASGQDVAFDGASVIRVLSATEFEINSGISTRPHNYARCGRVNQLTERLLSMNHYHIVICLLFIVQVISRNWRNRSKGRYCSKSRVYCD